MRVLGPRSVCADNSVNRLAGRTLFTMEVATNADRLTVEGGSRPQACGLGRRLNYTPETPLAIQREPKNDDGTAFALRGLAGVLIRESRSGEALAALREALVLSRKRPPRRGRPWRSWEASL
jgi:hypothetical protein